MWDDASTLTLRSASLHVFKPLELMANYTLLQYLVTFYWARKREFRVRILFFFGSIGVVSLVPFANSDQNLVSRLNDVSEACCTLTFLVQITIVGYDLNKKIKFQSIMYLTYVAEALISLNVVFAVVSLVATFQPELAGHALTEQLPNVVENVTMVFIFWFRVYCIAAVTSWQELVSTRRVELLCYFLFMTHEVPFAILEHVSGLSCEALQSLYNRATIAMCLVVTINAKLQTGRVSASARSSAVPTAVSRGRSVPRSVVIKRAPSSPAMVFVNARMETRGPDN